MDQNLEKKKLLWNNDSSSLLKNDVREHTNDPLKLFLPNHLPPNEDKTQFFHILLIDDDLALLQVLLIQFEILGIRVIGVENAQKAELCFHQALNQNHPFNLIITDYHLSEKLTGIDVFEQIHEISPTTPFILMTGSHDEIINQKWIAVGGKYYLQKPFCIDQLNAIILQIQKEFLAK